MKKILILGIFIKLLFIIFTFHGDLIDIWEPPAKALLNLNAIGPYRPPLAYLFFLIMSPIYFLSQIFGYWFLKIPYLFFDISVLILYKKILPQKKFEIALSAWWLNPVNIFGTYAQGQVEIIIGFFLIFSVYIFSLNKKYWSVFVIALTGAFKTIPFAFLPVMIMYTARNIRTRIKLTILSLALPVAVTLFFWKFSSLDIIKSYFPVPARPRIQSGIRPDTLYIFSAAFTGLLGYCLLIYLTLSKKFMKLFSFGEILLLSMIFFFIAFPADTIHRYIQIIPILILVLTVKNISMKYIWLWSLLLILGYLYVWPLEWGLVDHIYGNAIYKKDLRNFLLPIVNYENLAFIFRGIADGILLLLSIIIVLHSSKQRKI